MCPESWAQFLISVLFIKQVSVKMPLVGPLKDVSKLLYPESEKRIP